MKYLILFFIVFISLVTAAQGKLKPEELDELKKRTLIVEILEPGDFSELYNSVIEEVIESHWEINETVEYKTNKEITKLVNAKSEDYAVLFLTQSTHNVNYKSSQNLRSSDRARFLLNYGAIEDSRYVKRLNQISRPNGFMIPILHTSDVNDISKHELELSIQVMQNYMTTYIEKGSKLEIISYLKSETKNHCSTTSDLNLYVPEGLIDSNSGYLEMDSKYSGSGNVLSSNDAEIGKYLNDKEDVLVGIAIPWKIVRVESGSTYSIDIFYARAFINAKTLNIHTFNAGVAFGLKRPYFKNKEFRSYGNCK